MEIYPLKRPLCSMVRNVGASIEHSPSYDVRNVNAVVVASMARVADEMVDIRGCEKRKRLSLAKLAHTHAAW